MNLLDTCRKNGLILDGAMGSMLIQSGLIGGQASEFWNLEKPAAVQDIHRAYFDAGSDIATANTFGASALKLKKSGLENHCAEINQTGIRLAKLAAGDQKWVAGDMGPSGELLYPSGTLTMEAAIDNFAEQAAYLTEAGADILIVETMYDLDEALAAVTGIQRVSPLPVFVTLTFQQTPLGFATMMGNWLTDSMKRLEDTGIFAVGANCSLGSDVMIDLARQIRRSVQIPVIIQPNAGIPEIRGGKTVYPETPDQFADNIFKIKAEGAEIVGGCCGTSPEYIARICERIRL